MSPNSDSQNSVSILLLGIFLLLAGFDSVHKYGGGVGLASYVVLGGAFVYFAVRDLLPLAERTLTERSAAYLAAAAFIVLLAYVLVMYPLANNGVFGPGSDANDALMIAVTEFLQGHYPYYATTYLGNPIAPLPGTMFMATPFVLIDRLELQNLFWLAVFFLLLRSEFKSNVRALSFFAIILAVSPSIFQNLATGTDHVSNTIYILLAVWLMIRRIPDGSVSLLSKWAPTLLLGIGLSSRSNFFFLIPLLVTFIALRSDWKTAVKYVGAACAVAAAVTLPFYLYDPVNFSPLTLQTHKMNQFNSILPHAGFIFTATAGILAAALAFGLRRDDETGFFRGCAFVQLYSVIFPSVLYSILIGKVNFYFGHVGYGLFFLFFGSLGELKKIGGDRSISLGPPA
jgi:hypothetical protein